MARRFLFVLLPLLLLTAAARAAEWPQSGMVSLPADKPFDQLVADLDRAVEANDMGIVTRASASKGAAARGVEIPGNMVVGVFRNDFAVRMLEASVPAGIEAPLRFYLTEAEDGTSVLTYRQPSAVFAPYGSEELDRMAAELDAIFASIAEEAVR